MSAFPCRLILFLPPLQSRIYDYAKQSPRAPKSSDSATSTHIREEVRTTTMHVFDCEVRIFGPLIKDDALVCVTTAGTRRDATCLGKITPHPPPSHLTQEIEEDE